MSAMRCCGAREFIARDFSNSLALVWRVCAEPFPSTRSPLSSVYLRVSLSFISIYPERFRRGHSNSIRSDLMEFFGVSQSRSSSTRNGIPGIFLFSSESKNRWKGGKRWRRWMAWKWRRWQRRPGGVCFPHQATALSPFTRGPAVDQQPVFSHNTTDSTTRSDERFDFVVRIGFYGRCVCGAVVHMRRRLLFIIAVSDYSVVLFFFCCCCCCCCCCCRPFSQWRWSVLWDIEQPWQKKRQ